MTDSIQMVGRVERQQHTPEPWEVGASKRSIVYANGQFSKVIARMNFNGLGNTRYNDNEPEANAERIVACVNAMQGIEDPKEFVNNALNGVWKQQRDRAFNEINELTGRVYRITKQRDELLDALEEAFSHVDELSPRKDLLKSIIAKHKQQQP